MSDHEHHHHEHEHGREPVHTHEHAAPEGQDSGSQALSEALRSSFAIVKVVMVLLVIVFLWSGFFQVGPQEKAIKLRFGKPVGEGQQALLGSGLHWAFPYPIDEVVKIPYTERRTVKSTTGWYYTTPEQELSGEELPAGPSLNPVRDGYVITADRNIIHTKATLYYHIAEPIRYVFGFTNAAQTLQNMLDNALINTAAQFKVDPALYTDVGGFQDEVLRHVTELAHQADLGIVIDNCVIEGMIPPRQLKSIFDQVTTSREKRNTTIQDARSKANDILLKADAQAASIVYQAESQKTRYVASIQADAKRFTDLLPQFDANPSLFVQQTLVPVMGEALTNANFKSYLPTTSNGKPIELRLMLNREPPGEKSPAGPQ